jgi:hypothetical protein
MKVVIGKCKAQNVDAILMNHKVRLGNKYAFLFNKDVIGKAKNNLFTKPPKRTVTADLDAKLEDEANTSTGSGESDAMVITGDHINKVISAGVEDQAATTKKLLEDLLSFEEYLGFTELVSPDSVREVRKMTRLLIANALHKKTDFKTTSTESISLAAILLASERFELDLGKVMDFISNNIKPRAFNKPQRIRETKAYSLLGAIVESSKLIPCSP